ncbi:MAG TPA: hypothetical protein VFZ49_08125, partial [Pyrinomonadaceae bacterium]
MPRSASPRSVRAIAERQYGQTSTIVEPDWNSTGPAHEGQLAASTAIRHLRRQRFSDLEFQIS